MKEHLIWFSLSILQINHHLIMRGKECEIKIAPFLRNCAMSRSEFHREFVDNSTKILNVDFI